MTKEDLVKYLKEHLEKLNTEDFEYIVCYFDKYVLERRKNEK